MVQEGVIVQIVAAGDGQDWFQRGFIDLESGGEQAVAAFPEDNSRIVRAFHGNARVGMEAGFAVGAVFPDPGTDQGIVHLQDLADFLAAEPLITQIDGPFPLGKRVLVVVPPSRVEKCVVHCSLAHCLAVCSLPGTPVGDYYKKKVWSLIVYL